MKPSLILISLLLTLSGAFAATGEETSPPSHRPANEYHADSPHKTVITPRTRSIAQAWYYKTMQNKIEMTGALNFPEKGGKKLFGELVVYIPVFQDGTIYEKEGGPKIERSSGSADLDEAALRIIRKAAPFPPIPTEDRTPGTQDVWELTTQFNFTHEETLKSDAVASTAGATGQPPAQPSPSPVISATGVDTDGLSDEMRNALLRLIDSQHMDENWPLIVQAITAGAPTHVIEGAVERYSQAKNLTDSDKEKARAILTELSPGISSDFANELRKLDAHQLISDMVTTIYPKYYSPQEILEMSKFYDGPAFQNTVKRRAEAEAENMRTGEDIKAILKRYESKIPPDEMQAFADFSNSPVGKKQHELAPQINADSQKFLFDRLSPIFYRISEKYRAIFAERMKAPSHN